MSTAAPNEIFFFNGAQSYGYVKNCLIDLLGNHCLSHQISFKSMDQTKSN